MRSFNLALAGAVRETHGRDDFPLVIGGDCSILLGALAGARHTGPLSLVHIDGHSDFRHPGNSGLDEGPHAAAGMDLALATGRGEALATEWPGITGPLVADDRAVQLGERENRNEDYPWRDLATTAISRIDVFEALAIGPVAIFGRIMDILGQVPDQRFWLHFDVDALDGTAMPAVDCPGSPGLTAEDAAAILNPLVADPRCCGMTVCIFDPDLDPDGRSAATIVAILKALPFPRALRNQAL